MSAPEKKSAAALLAEGDKLFTLREYDAARTPYLEAVTAAQAEKNRSVETEALAQVARTWLIAGKREEGLPWLEKAKALADPKDPVGWSRYLGVRGRFEWQDKNEPKAVETFKEMYAYCSQRKLGSRAIDAAHMLAIVGDLAQKIEWSLKVIKEAGEAGEISWLGPTWNNLGWNYDDKGEYEKSLDALLKAREYHWRGTTEIPKLVADWSVGHAYRMTGQLEKAGAWLRPCLAWAERLAATGNSEAGEWVGSTCRELGELAFAQKDFPHAREFFERAVKELKAAGMPEWDAEGWKKFEARSAEVQSAGK